MVYWNGWEVLILGGGDWSKEKGEDDLSRARYMGHTRRKHEGTSSGSLQGTAFGVANAACQRKLRMHKLKDPQGRFIFEALN